MNKETLSYKNLRILLFIFVILVSFAAIIPFSTKSEIQTNKPCMDLENGSPGMVINSNVGLGETVVSGEVDADQDKLVYDVKTGKPKVWQRHLGTKLTKTVKTADGTQSVETTPQERSTHCLTVEEAEELGYAGQVIAKHYGRPMDIEWVIKNGKIKIVQSRPITTWVDDPLVLVMDYMQVPEKEAVVAREKARVKGLPGSPRSL